MKFDSDNPKHMYHVAGVLQTLGYGLIWWNVGFFATAGFIVSIIGYELAKNNFNKVGRK